MGQISEEALLFSRHFRNSRGTWRSACGMEDKVTDLNAARCFAEAVEALANQVEHVEPSRQELVSFGVDMGTYLESYFLQVQQEMKEKAGVFSEEEVSEISGRLLERVDGQRERYLTRQREAEEALEALDRVDAQRGRYLETQQKMLAN